MGFGVLFRKAFQPLYAFNSVEYLVKGKDVFYVKFLCQCDEGGIREA